MEDFKIGVASIKIEMLDDDGVVIETCDAHVCTGDPNECETPAICDSEQCAEPEYVAGPDRPVYAWSTANGMDYFSCAPCLSADDYVRRAGGTHAIAVGTNPETGETIACHTDAEGNAQNACLNCSISFPDAPALLDHVREIHVS